MKKDFLSQDDLRCILEHATREYPFECCGIVTSAVDVAGKDIVYPCTNIQNRLHGENPSDHPRDARTAYYIDPDEALRILKTLKGNTRYIKAFYHSHTEHHAYFSEEDRKRALVWGEPAYPGTGYIVVAVNGGRVDEIKVFVWDEGLKDFKQKNAPWKTSL